MTTIQNNQAFDFLLGKLDDDATSAIELKFLDDSASFEQMLTAESELIDAYASDRLSKEDRKRFENRLLINPRQRRRVGFARTFASYLSRTPFDEPKPSFTLRIADFLTFRFAFALVALFIVAATVWFAPGLVDSPSARLALRAEEAIVKPEFNPPAIEPNERIEVPAAVAEEPKAKPADRKSPLVATFALVLGGTRGDNGNNEFKLAKRNGLVLLTLSFERNEYRSYFVTIETVEGNRVWSGTRRGRGASGTGEVSVKVPAKVFRSGDYIVSLAGRTPTGILEPVGDFPLSVR